MRMVLRQALTVAGAWVFSLMASCALVTPPSSPPERATLNQLPRDAANTARSSARLLVLPLDSVPPYDTVQMAYTTRPHEIAYFSHHEWSAPPAQMLYQLLTQTMERTGYFAVVITLPPAAGYDYALRTKLLELRQDFTSAAPVVLLSLRLELTNVRERQVIGATNIAVQEPMVDRTPDAGVAAANQAAAAALQQAVGFVVSRASENETARTR